MTTPPDAGLDSSTFSPDGGVSPDAAVPNGAIDVPLSDGVTLRTWIYAPEGAGPFPFFVVRNPYASLDDGVQLAAYARFFTDRGIGLVWQAVRGTGGSGGDFVPYLHEVADARDTLTWLGAQPYSNGRFAAGGGSYLGYTAWAAAAADPRVVAVISDDTAADEEMTRHGGVLDGYLLSWWSFVERDRFADEGELTAITNALDPTTLDERVLGRDIPYWNQLLTAGLEVYPRDASLRTLARDLCVPALHVIEGETGWRDPVETWEAIAADGCARERDHQWLIVAPEGHAVHFSAFGVGDTWVTPDMLTMLEAFLLESAPIPTWPRVRYRPETSLPTREATEWPPLDATPVTFHLAPPGPSGEGTLSTDASPPAHWTMVSDPAGTDPCAVPTATWFTSTGLAAPLVVAGAPRLTLTGTADAPDFDVIVELYDYLPGPEIYRGLGVGAVRARHREGGADAPVLGRTIELTIDLTASSRRVAAGHQLTISIAPSACGHVENPNSGEPIDRQTTRRIARVDFDLLASSLVIPTVP